MYVTKGDTAGLTKQLQQGADPNSRNFVGETPLHVASRYGLTEIIGRLVQHKANPNLADDKGRTPLHVAVDLPTYYKLLNFGADKYATDLNGNGILHYAAHLSSEDIAKVCVTDQNIVTHKNNLGRTPMMTATLSENANILKLLLSIGINVDQKDHEGMTALHHATEQDNEGLARLLIANKADVNCRDNSGSTPLHYAAYFSKNKVLLLLLKNGADTQAVMPSLDGHDLTPLDLARTANNFMGIELLAH